MSAEDRASRRYEKIFVDAIDKVIDNEKLTNAGNLKGEDLSYADYVEYSRSKCLPNDKIPENFLIC